ncbi:hypothetical protein HPB47_008812 [Ixodes persulcatus]|uniref:Uncharacterized protein n=1 Tax=Ixodes persulcatus TaxID=34615 RepID=A0AC60P3R1_IXOPE|nr:hypothetical protein HPB47_008812 [Ixodes persulcatus]
MKTRSNDWWSRIVLTQFTDNDWKENFRMTRAFFNELVSHVAPFMSSKPDCVRAPVPLEKRVAIALYKMASCCEYRVVRNQFGVRKSTVKKYVYMFCRTIVKYYLRDYIRLPSTEEAENISRNFEARCHLPQIFGAIDGTHVPILAPKKGYRDFVNRKLWTSFNVQAIRNFQRWWYRGARVALPSSWMIGFRIKLLAYTFLT